MLRIVMALLLGLGIIVTLIALMERPEPSSRQEPEANEQPDYWLAETVIERFDAEGEPMGRLQAERLTHFTFDGHSELVQVEATRRVSASLYWWMRADHGHVSGDRSRVRLTGDAQLERRVLDAPTAILQSERLIFHPEQDRVETDAAILLRRGPSQTTGVGMNADLAADRMQIENEVRTIHVDRSSR